MGIVNRRNAVLGWLAWTAGKRVAKRKAREAVPGIDPDSKRPNRGAIVAAVATLVGAVWFFRRLRSDDPADAASGD